MQQWTLVSAIMLFRRAAKKPLARMRYQSRGRLLSIGMLSTISCGCTIYYNSISEKDKRQLKVTIGGVRRFLRWGSFSVTLKFSRESVQQILKQNTFSDLLKLAPPYPWIIGGPSAVWRRPTITIYRLSETSIKDPPNGYWTDVWIMAACTLSWDKDWLIWTTFYPKSTRKRWK